MSKKKRNVFEISTVIKAPPSKVWDALTKPEPVRQYIYGAENTADWKIGSSIRWKGFLEDRPYENRGTVLSVLPEKLLECAHWSNLSELADTPENYITVTCRLASEKEGTKFSVILEGDGLPAPAWKHFEFGWRVISYGLKKTIEREYGDYARA